MGSFFRRKRRYESRNFTGDEKFINKKFVVLLLIGAITCGIFISVGAPTSRAVVDSSVYLPISINQVETIGEWEFPFPLGDYGIRLEIKFIGNSSIPISCFTDRDFISPGESITFSLSTSSTELNLESYLVVYIMDKGESVFSHEIIIPLPSLRTLDTFYSGSITIPVLPLEIAGIPIELSSCIGIDITSSISTQLKAEGLQPSVTEITFEEDRLTTNIVFTKPSDVGCRITADSIRLHFDGHLQVGIGLSILGFLTPLKYDFSPLPLARFSTAPFITETELVKLKTPINVEIGIHDESLELGESLTIYGEISPPVGDLLINVLAREVGGRWFTISATTTLADGSFSVNWAPVGEGEYEVKAYHSGSEFITEATSSTDRLLVAAPPKPTPPPTPFPYALVVGAIGCMSIVILAVVLKKTKKRRTVKK